MSNRRRPAAGHLEARARRRQDRRDAAARRDTRHALEPETIDVLDHTGRRVDRIPALLLVDSWHPTRAALDLQTGWLLDHIDEA